MPECFSDRLLAAIEAKGSPVCVGLDASFERLPSAVRAGATGSAGHAARVADFFRQVATIVAPFVPAVKPQSAYFEQMGPAGVQAYFEVVEYAHQMGLIVIGDVKRGDIGSTAEAYAEAHLAGPGKPDAITVNGYLGWDGLAPFVKAAAAECKGLFVLVRTSNPSAGTIQDFAGAGGKKLFEHVAEQVALLGDQASLTGRRGYSSIGAVVGATYPAEARRLRELMPHQIFLVPGYGAQGATAADCAAAFKPDGTGAIVNASRSVIYAYETAPGGESNWPRAIESAARTFAEDIRKAVGW